MKAITSLTVDVELLLEAKKRKLNLSQEFNNHLKVVLGMKEEDNIDLDLDDRIVSVKARLMSLESEKDKIKKEKEKNITMRREL